MGVALGQLLPLLCLSFLICIMMISPMGHLGQLGAGTGINLPLQEIVKAEDGVRTEWGGVSSPFAGVPGCSEREGGWGKPFASLL